MDGRLLRVVSSIYVSDGKTHFDGPPKPTTKEHAAINHVDGTEKGANGFVESLRHVTAEEKREHDLKANREYVEPPQGVISSPWKDENNKIASRVRKGEYPSKEVEVDPKNITYIQAGGVIKDQLEDMIKQGPPSTAMRKTDKSSEGAVAIRDKEGKIYLLEGNHRAMWAMAYGEKVKLHVADEPDDLRDSRRATTTKNKRSTHNSLSASSQEISQLRLDALDAYLTNARPDLAVLVCNANPRHDAQQRDTSGKFAQAGSGKGSGPTHEAAKSGHETLHEDMANAPRAPTGKPPTPPSLKGSQGQSGGGGSSGQGGSGPGGFTSAEDNPALPNPGQITGDEKVDKEIKAEAAMKALGAYNSYIESVRNRMSEGREMSQTRNRFISQKVRDDMSDEDFAGPGQSFPIKTQADVMAGGQEHRQDEARPRTHQGRHQADRQAEGTQVAGLMDQG